MSQRTIYFGTQEYMTFVPCPLRDMTRGLNGWNENGTFLGGGGYSESSRAGHRIYNMAWPKKGHEDLYELHAFANGDFGRGNIYFVDPFASSTNVMPQAWSSPWQACEDGGPNLAGLGEDEPALISTPSNTQGYPINAAQYTLAGTEGTLNVWIPIPPGYTLYVGAHGSATGSAGVAVNTSAFTDPFADAFSSGTGLTLLGANTTTLTNHTVAGPGGATISIGGTGTLDLYAVVAFLLPTGTTAPTGKWRPGEGHSGCKFVGFPTDTAYSAPLDLRATTAVLKEVGSWPGA